eukprot:scaffold173084_cov40-Cyclotella_meneghiniana.AAC.2
MSDNPSSSSSLLNEEETLVPLRDDNAKRSRHNSDDAETVSSAPPRIEVQVNSSMLREVHADTNNDAADAIDDVDRDSSSNITEANGGDSNHHHRISSASPLLITPTNKNTSLSSSTNSEEQQLSASTKKFVTFLSDVDSTPIASSNTNKQFVDDDTNDANDMMMVEQPSLMDDADEKKEDNTVIASTAALTSRGYSREYSESTLDSWQNTASADGNGTSITEGTTSPLPMIMQENDDNVSSSANNNEDTAPSSIIETVHTSLQVKATPPPSRPIPPPAIDTTIHNTKHSSSSRNNTVLYASQHPNRRSITLRLVEEISKNNNDHLTSSLHSNVLTTPFKRLTSLRKFRSLSLSTVMIPAEKKMDMTDRQNNNNNNNTGAVNDMSEGDTRISNDDGVTNVDRGIISVTWYEGTTSKEMQDHVYNCVLRKLKSSVGGGGGGGSSNALKGTLLEDVRLLDENVVPHEGSYLFMYLLYYVLFDMNHDLTSSPTTKLSLFLTNKTEVVLCPFLPDNSHFLLKFKTSTPTPPPPTTFKPTYHPLYGSTIPPYISRAPDSPSAEVSPHPSSGKLNKFNNHSTNNANVNAQLQLLNAATALLQSGMGQQQQHQRHQQQPLLPKLPMLPNVETVPREFKEQHTNTNATAEGGNNEEEAENLSPNSMDDGKNNNDNNNNNLTTDELIEQQLRQLNELFLLRNVGGSVVGNTNNVNLSNTQTTLKDVVLQQQQPNPSTSTQEKDDELHHHDPQLMLYWKSQEKKQVIFTIANYFVLFMSLIAISAEIQSRLPQWMNWVQDNYDSVQNCATDNDALFECISQGNFSGLVASFMLWATQSASAKRIFLFGFDTPKKLWTVVYEALVTAVCWGTSYIFIRRGLNPNTRERFLQKYWKDAVYGSLAGFNAAFMKAVLKNLVPQDVALQAIETRQLRIFDWLSRLMAEE